MPLLQVVTRTLHYYRFYASGLKKKLDICRHLQIEQVCKFFSL